MRTALINDNMYPHRRTVGGTWCHRLVRGLGEHAFHLVTISDVAPAAPAYEPPANVISLTSIEIAGPSNAPRRGRPALAHRRPATHAAVLLCRSMLEDTPHSNAMFRSALRRLAVGGTHGTHPLGGVPLAAVLLDAWNAAHAPHPPAPGATPPRPALPAPSAADAADAAFLLEQAVRPLATPMPLTELNHAADAGLSALVALGAKWRTGTPYVLTEHQPYLSAPLLDGTAGRPGVRAVLLRFLRALARLAYAEASRIAAPTDRMRRWAIAHGARPDAVTVVPYGVDPHSCPVAPGEPAEPSLAWLGPERDLVSMLCAFEAVRDTRSDTRLIVAGPATPVDPRIGPAVAFLGPVGHRRSAFTKGRVVVVAATEPTMPYALIEAMMCGRPTICVGDADVAELAGDGALVVPPDDPDTLADACLYLLESEQRRRDLGTAGHAVARTRYALRTQLDRFRDLYELASHDTSAPTERLVPVAASPAHR